LIHSRHRIHKKQAYESDDVNASRRKVIHVKVNVKEWLAKEPIQQYLYIYRAVHQNDATLKNKHKKGLQALVCE